MTENKDGAEKLDEQAAAKMIATLIYQELDIDITGDELLALLRRFLDDAERDE